MISFATNIQSTTEPLRKVPVADICRSIRQPKPDFEAQIRQLRIIRNIDEKQYRTLKTRLPYIVCGIFNPPFRRTENFAYIQHFILDIDHISSKDLDLMQLRTEIEKDDRVMMCFVSPSEDGLKVLFQLEERCYDTGLFSLFYKLFAKQFATQYNVTQVIDSRTSDVTRACFVSMDPQAYFNEKAVPVNLSAYVNESDPTAMFDLKREMVAEEKKQQQAWKEAASQSSGMDLTDSEPTKKADVDADVMATLRAILEPEKQRKREKPPVYVPEQLNEVMGGLKEYIEKTGLIVTEVVNIQYAKKIRVRAQQRQAEVNLFYGKRGYSVVVSPRTGTDGDLNEMVAALISQYLTL